jgi:hypothetical protein
MAGEEKNINTISKKNTGFPAYLDFTQLRRQGIEYLGKLSGQIWTDHNVHDPGITILEVLCYAILDLGYRTHLPVEDILAPDPGKPGNDNNFFTSAQILTCNPLTITDYRKLLIDIEGVRNAWLTPADGGDDAIDICRKQAVAVNPNAAIYLNGLYHVFIELEEYPQPGDDTNINVFAEKILNKVKAALMSHRNLCEDFLDIYILCRLELGVCASVELENDADAETVYINLAEKLNAFFSPAPKFYTLPQMLDKKISMEDIFSGRPYSSTSFGFTDNTELEAIQLNKEIHLSDVYNVFFSVPGIKKVSELQLRTCNDQGITRLHGGWKFNIPENHIPSFSVKCSGINFNRNGLKVIIDTKKFETHFELSFSHNGKVPFHIPSPYLDAVQPEGVFSAELDNYYSIQNDFPEVYAIGEGQLPSDVPDSRKAQALQLKGYLLFFDQLLANYLSQLKNIRSLFSLSAPEQKADRHTYFLNKINTIPERDKLLRFSPGSSLEIGDKGSILVTPVPTVDWEQFIANTNNTANQLETLPLFTFHNMDAAQNAILLLQNDLVSDGETKMQVVKMADGLWCYAIRGTAAEYVLVSKKTFSKEKEAYQHAASVKYIGQYPGNYRTFITPAIEFSFDIDFNLTEYTDYLLMLVEDEQLYGRRRKDFLNHLLARFAEKFTDFALLTWQDAEAIPAAEHFLTNYDNLSRNRGRAYDYHLNGWNTENTSGFEKKVKALSGLSNGSATLCNFVVEPCEDYFLVEIKSGQTVFFTSAEKFDTQDEAEAAAAGIINAMKQVANYKAEYMAHAKYYELQLHYGRSIPAIHSFNFQNSNHAEQLAGYFVRSFNNKPDAHDVAVHDYIWRADLLNHKNELLAYSVAVTEHAAEIRAQFPTLAKGISDTKVWTPVDKATIPALRVHKNQANEVMLINTAAFKLDINDTIIGKPGKFTYDLLDHDHSFKINPKSEFDSARKAGEHSVEILAAAANTNNWKVERDEQTGQYAIHILKNNETEATFVTQYAGVDEATEQINKIYQLVKENCYTITESKHPKSWKFYYTLGYMEGDTWRFESEPSYPSYNDAKKVANEFYAAIPQLQATVTKTEVMLQAPKNKKIPVLRLSYAGGSQPAVAEAAVTRLISQQQEIRQMIDKVDEQQLSIFVQPERQTPQPGFMYRLVNKNRIPARSLQSFGKKEETQLLKRKLAAQYKQQQWAPMICLGGDITERITDAQGNVLYHYHIRFRNLTFVEGFELTLFTSVTGYETQEDAEKAFEENYLCILHFASDKNEYGKHINLEPVDPPRQPLTAQIEPIAYITAEAAALFRKKYNSLWLDEMARLANAYPIKAVEYGSDEFAALFCKEKTTPPPGGCRTEPIEIKYYFMFSLQQPIVDLPDSKWISTQYFNTPADAMNEFVYFNRLLDYAGNWFVDCDTCSTSGNPVFRFYIYEVLAESINCFQTVEEAWGETGVEAFICAIQSGKGLNQYARKTDCCYSLYTGCGEGLAIHPCTYDTPEKRNKAMDELYSRQKQLTEKGAFNIKPDAQGIVISNIEGVPTAIIAKTIRSEEEICDIVLQAVDDVQDERSSWEQTEKLYTLTNAAGDIIIRSHEKITHISLEQWKGMLREWACYFPLSRTELGAGTIDASTGERIKTYKYCVEIKIPGFSNCGTDEGPTEPCNCNTPVRQPEPFCYVAWKSDCCFATCTEAVRRWAIISRLILSFENYHPVFDCTCGIYGIALHYEWHLSSMPIAEEKKIAGVLMQTHVLPGQILARNPQCYQTPDDVCVAAETTRRLVNLGGLHVLEHILLRPHCYQECTDCYDVRMQYCNEYFNCHYPDYVSENEDPCDTTKDVPFLPGTDPYSFIATVILPAWPSVFRDEHKRKQAEHILYSEAPAHILLRILWLRPYDFCRLETAFKEWKKWLAGSKTCENQFSVCDLLTLLLHTSYSCLDACKVCIPCSEPGIKNDVGCSGDKQKQEEQQPADDYAILNLVNSVYCLPEYNCGQRREAIDDHPGKPVEVAHSVEPPVLTSSQPSEKTVVAGNKEKTITKKESATKEKKETLPVEAKKPVVISQKEKAHFVNSRHKKYSNLAVGVLEHTKENPLAIKTRAFLQSADPAIAKLEMLVKEIIQNKKPVGKNVPALNKNQALDLLQAIICHYLDKISFNGKNTEQFKALDPVLNTLKKAKVDIQAIHNYWDAAGISVYEPELDINLIKKLFAGNKK